MTKDRRAVWVATERSDPLALKVFPLRHGTQVLGEPRPPHRAARWPCFLCPSRMTGAVPLGALGTAGLLACPSAGLTGILLAAPVLGAGNTHCRFHSSWKALWPWAFHPLFYFVEKLGGPVSKWPIPSHRRWSPGLLVAVPSGVTRCLSVGDQEGL